MTAHPVNRSALVTADSAEIKR